MDDNKIINGKCWVAFFDILGFKDQVRRFAKEDDAETIEMLVVGKYQNILMNVENKVKRNFAPVKYYFTHFSDSFVFFVPDESDDSYLTIDQVGRLFFVEMITEHIPFHGALSVGKMYIDRTRGIYVGVPLIDAYEYCEKQEWIGYVMTPSVREELGRPKFDLKGRSDYAEYDVPVKKEVLTSDGIRTRSEKLFAHRINKYTWIEQSIQEMQQEAKNTYGEEYETRCKTKFENTLDFIRATRPDPCSLE